MKNKLFILSSLLTVSLYASSEVEDIEYKLRGIAAVVNKNMNDIEKSEEKRNSIQENLESIEKNINALKDGIQEVHQVKESISILKNEINQLKNSDKENRAVINEMRNNINSLLRAPKNINISQTKIFKNEHENIESATKLNLATEYKQTIDVVNHTNIRNKNYYVEAKSLNLRKAPYLDAEVIDTLTSGTKLSVLNCDEYGWCEIDSPKHGYVAKHLLGGF